MLGHTTMIGMVGETTEEIAEEDGDRVRVIESSVENYWYGVPPLTWFLTPVLTTVTIEYEPGIEALQRLLEDREDLPPGQASALETAIERHRDHSAGVDPGSASSGQ